MDDWIKMPREATDAMLEAVWTDCARPTPEERMALELCDNKLAFKIKMRERYRVLVAAANPVLRDE